MNERILAHWRSFKAKPGGDHIATPVSLDFLSTYCDQKGVQSILELGAGIGTMSALLSRETYDAYEDVSFCIDQCRTNAPAVNLITDYRTLPPQQDYDLVIIDGGNGGKMKAWGPKNGGYAEATATIVSYVRPKAVYVEGRRTPQLIAALWALSGRYRVRMCRVPGAYVMGSYCKGGTLLTTSRGSQVSGVLALSMNLLRVGLDLARRRKLKGSQPPNQSGTHL